MDIVINDPIEQSMIGVARTLAELPHGLRNELSHALRVLRQRGVLRLEFVSGNLSGTIAVRASNNIPLSRALPRHCVTARGRVESALQLLLWFDAPKSRLNTRTGMRSCIFCGAPHKNPEAPCMNTDCTSHTLWRRINGMVRAH